MGMDVFRFSLPCLEFFLCPVWNNGRHGARKTKGVACRMRRLWDCCACPLYAETSINAWQESHYLFFSKSLISVRSFSSVEGAAVSSSFFLENLEIALIIRNTQRAIIKKSTVFWINTP